ncbi:hypothetical protein J3R82DRAFT_2619, partial [Butyriboletus roseoflavus]
VTLCIAFAAGADILIAIFLTYLLVRKRSTTAFAKTASLLQRLTVFAVNTGIWTATFALLSLVLLQVYPTNLLYVVFGIPAASIYCNTFLANLNARSYIRGEALPHDDDVDLFASSASPLSDTIKTDRR